MQYIDLSFIFAFAKDLMAGKRVYLTASTARDHISKLWEKEGRLTEQLSSV